MSLWTWFWLIVIALPFGLSGGYCMKMTLELRDERKRYR